MNKQIRITASALGIYAGLLGIEHGIFEILQGNNPVPGLLIKALGMACQPETVWHACFPALTLIPNFMVTGILAVIAGFAVLFWSGWFVQKRQGGPILIALSLLMIPVGAGFVPAFIGVMAGSVGTRITSSLSWWRKRSEKWLNFLSAFWPWVIYLIYAWALLSWVLGYYFNKILLNLGYVLFIIVDIGLPLFSIFSGIARDAKGSDRSRV